MSVLIETSQGDIVIDVFVDDTPIAAKNFLKLCAIKYYNNCEFFLVEQGFLVQTGDPSNTGNRGRSVYGICYGAQADVFDDEIRSHLRHRRRGVVGMANRGKNANASQFYITSGEDLSSLDDRHTIFGEVAEGMDVLMRIDAAFVDERRRPYQIIRIRHTIVLHDPFPDPQGLPVVTDSPPPDIVDDPSRIAEDENVDEGFDQRQLEELELSRQRKEARSRAEVLEMIGDLPDADVKPPENVLFVAKLNPVTRSEDLEIIFSRFGECKAEVIRDRKTNDSLNYAFVEFEDRATCEAAYFKMDNTLVDDRRIRVDFSQSVSRLWNRVRRGQRERFDEREHGAGRPPRWERSSGRPMLPSVELGEADRSDRHGDRSYRRNILLDTPRLAEMALQAERNEGRFRAERSAERHQDSDRPRREEDRKRPRTPERRSGDTERRPARRHEESRRGTDDDGRSARRGSYSRDDARHHRRRSRERR